jgi:ribosomal protein L11 methyltransferase
MEYVHYAFRLFPVEPASEILIADLGERGFDSFTESDAGLDAYIPSSLDAPDILNDLMIEGIPDLKWEVVRTLVPDQNWNAVWESNFEPVVVDDYCLLRAPFHEVAKRYPVEIVMQPRMAFGTGHHPTTFLMIRLLMGLDLQGKRVIDMGCGTSVLAIFAHRHGASPILAIDNDEWAVTNSLEHIVANNCEDIQVMQGNASSLHGHQADVFIANINRNILLNDLAAYAPCLPCGGALLLSGFYQEDVPVLMEKAKQYGFELTEQQTKNRWVALRLTKSA